MNKLKGMISYLSGPIDNAPDLGVGWRRKLTPILRDMGMIILDPTNKPIHDFDAIENREYRLKLKQEGKYDVLCKQLRKLRSYDLRCVDKCDICIVYIDKETYSVGTFEEVFTANKQKKPCLLFCKQGRLELNDWLYATLPAENIFENIEEVIKYLKDIDTGVIVPTNRWVFFNWDRIIKGD